jgi:hypothetical protein
MQQVYFRHPDRQRFQLRLLYGKQFPRNGTDMLLIGTVDLVAPFAGPAVEVIPVGKFSPGKEVVFNKTEWTFDAARAIGIANGVRPELKPVPLAESGHFRYGNHIYARSPQYDDMGVVDHGDPGASIEVLQGFRQEDLAFKASESRIELEKQHARITQHRRGGLHRLQFSSHMNLMGRRVVLHLLARFEVILSGRYFGLLPDMVPAAKGRQRRIGKIGAR